MYTEELQNIADAIENQANPMKACSDFNGWSVADSMGYIAEAMLRIADVMERQALDNYKEEA
jgi:hypothetical protein